MKTPEEIKMGLKRHLCNDDVDCVSICCKDGCPYLVDAKNGELTCGQLICNDTIVYIQQLESTISQVSKALCSKENASLEEILQEVSQIKSRLALAEAERDAAVHDLNHVKSCGTCKRYEYLKKCQFIIPCVYGGKRYFEWRGVCEENTKEDGYA